MLERPGDEGRPQEVALVCHPHPLYGGTMHNKVVHRIARGLLRSGNAVLRINFRGVGLSEGSYDAGRGETADAHAAMEWLRTRYPDARWTLAGFSFGSAVILSLGASVPGAARLIAAGYPASHPWPLSVDLSGIPKIFIQSTNDEYGPRWALESFVATLAEPKRLIWIPARDHFFAGGLGDLEDTVWRLGPTSG